MLTPTICPCVAGGACRKPAHHHPQLEHQCAAVAGELHATAVVPVVSCTTPSSPHPSPPASHTSEHHQYRYIFLQSPPSLRYVAVYAFSSFFHGLEPGQWHLYACPALSITADTSPSAFPFSLALFPHPPPHHPPPFLPPKTTNLGFYIFFTLLSVSVPLERAFLARFRGINAPRSVCLLGRVVVTYIRFRMFEFIWLPFRAKTVAMSLTSFRILGYWYVYGPSPCA